MSLPSVSILIVSYNVKQYLRQALYALERSDYAGNLEMIVVDNNSFDGTVDFIKQDFPKVKLIANSTNCGFGKAVNQAAELAVGDFFLILNPDTIVQENTINIMVDYLLSHSDVGMIGPKILNADGSLQLACKRSFPTIGVAIPKLMGLNRLFPKAPWANRYNLTYLDPEQIHTVDAISGSCMFLQADLFRVLNGFDERFFMFGEDLDFCYRVKQAGKTVRYIPTTQIIHYQGESVKSAPYDSIDAFYNAMILFADKHFPRGHGLFVRIGIRFGIFVRKLYTLVAGLRSQIISVFLDMTAVTTAFLIAILIKFSDFEPIIVSGGLVPLVYVLFWILVGATFQLYSRYILSYSRAILASLAGFLFAVAFTYFFKQYAFSRFVILAATLMVAVMLPGWRMIIHYLISRGWFRPVNSRQLLFARKTIIISTDSEGIRIAHKLLKRFDTGLELVGFCDDQVVDLRNLPLPFLGSIDDLRAIVQTRAIREIIFSSGRLSNEQILGIMQATRDLKLTYRMVPKKQDILLGKALIEEIGDFSFINIEYPLFRGFHRLSKRIFDLSVASIALILFSPIIIGCYLIGKIKKVEFWGADGTRFQAAVGIFDNRFLRKIPLLKQVLAGKMSIVGASLIATTETDPKIMFRPGLTSLDLVRNVKYNAEDRRMLNHYYIQHQTFTLDLEILMKSVFGN